MTQDVVYPGERSCGFEKNMFSFAFGCNVLTISVRSLWSHVSFNACVFLLISCFDDLFIGVSGVLISPTITVLQSISPFMALSICLLY